jgi:hypothetical protein
MSPIEESLAMAKKILVDVDQRMQDRMTSGAPWGATERSVIALSGAVDELIIAIRSIAQRETIA